MSNDERFRAGQEVWIYDINARRVDGPSPGEVIRVGRVLVTVMGPYGRRLVFRKTGRANDKRGHQWIRTTEERFAADRRHAAVHRLKEGGFEIRLGVNPPLEVLEALVETLEAKADPA